MGKIYYKHIFIILTCCGMVAASVGLCTNAYGVFYTPMCQEFETGRAAVTMHATISGIMTGLFGPVVVKLVEKIPLKIVACTGILLSCLSFLLMAWADRVWILNLCGVIRGIGNSCFYMPIITVVLGNWFKKSLGSITGGVMAFSGVAGAVLSPVLNSLIEKMGYRAASIFSACFIAAMALPLCFCFLRISPEECGVLPYGSGEDVFIQKSESRKVNKFSASSPVFLMLAGMTFSSVFITGLTSHLSGYAESIQMESGVGAAMISAVMAGNILSKFASGMLSDRIGVRKAFSFMFLISILGVGMMYVMRTKALLLTASFLFGTIYASSAVGLPAITRDIYGDKQYGEAYSIISVISLIAPSVSMVFIGYVYDLTGKYASILILCMIFGILSLLLCNIAKMAAKRYNTCIEDRIKERGD